MKTYAGRMTSQHMREIVFDDHGESRQAFDDALRREVSDAIDALAEGYGKFQDLQARLPEGDRSAVVFAFLHLANNSMIGALHLLMSGYLAPAGNLMRHFAEATAMALLCSERSNMTFESYNELGSRYPFHGAIDRLSRPKIQRAVGVDADSWKSFKEISGFYGDHSHASDMAIAANIIFDRPGVVVLGGQFDPGKVDQYRIELSRIASASRALASAYPTIDRNVLDSMVGS